MKRLLSILFLLIIGITLSGCIEDIPDDPVCEDGYVLSEDRCVPEEDPTPECNQGEVYNEETEECEEEGIDRTTLHALENVDKLTMITTLTFKDIDTVQTMEVQVDSTDNTVVNYTVNMGDEEISFTTYFTVEDDKMYMFEYLEGANGFIKVEVDSTDDMVGVDEASILDLYNAESFEEITEGVLSGLIDSSDNALNDAVLSVLESTLGVDPEDYEFNGEIGIEFHVDENNNVQKTIIDLSKYFPQLMYAVNGNDAFSPTDFEGMVFTIEIVEEVINQAIILPTNLVEDDHPNTMDTMNSYTTDQVINGSLEYFGDVDVLRLEVDTPGFYYVEMNDGMDFAVELYNSHGFQKNPSDLVYTFYGLNNRVWELSSGVYYIVVHDIHLSYTENVPYSIALTPIEAEEDHTDSIVYDAYTTVDFTNYGTSQIVEDFEGDIDTVYIDTDLSSIYLKVDEGVDVVSSFNTHIRWSLQFDGYVIYSIQYISEDSFNDESYSISFLHLYGDTEKDIEITSTHEGCSGAVKGQLYLGENAIYSSYNCLYEFVVTEAGEYTFTYHAADSTHDLDFLFEESGQSVNSDNPTIYLEPGTYQIHPMSSWMDTGIFKVTITKD